MIDEAIILCGGQGTRLAGVLPEGQQKCASLVAGQPFLQYLLNQLIDAGIKKAVLAEGVGAARLAQSFGDEYGSHPEEYLELVHSHEDRPLGTGGAVRKALEHVKGERFFVLNGDSYIDYSLHQFATWFDLVQPDAAALLVQSPDYKSKTLGLMEEQGDWINGGVYLFERSLFSDVPEGSCPCSLEESLFPRWKQQGKKLLGYQTWSRFIDIGTPEGLARAEDFFKETQPCQND